MGIHQYSAVNRLALSEDLPDLEISLNCFSTYAPLSVPPLIRKVMKI